MSLPSLHYLIEPHITRFVCEDDSATDLARKVRAVLEECQLMSSQISYIARFVVNGVDLCSMDSREINPRHKLAGITLLDCLIDVNDENNTRKIDIANCLRKIFESDKVAIENDSILRVAALCVGHIARTASSAEIDFLQTNYLPFAFKLMINRLDTQRLSSSLILTQLALNSPALIFSQRTNLFSKIWDCVSDRHPLVRQAAAETLEAGLQLVSQREDMTEYLRQALKIINDGFQSSASSEKIISSLMILDIIAGGVVVSLDKLRGAIQDGGLKFEDVVWRVLQRKDSTDNNIKCKVIEVVPRLATAFSSTFLSTTSTTSPYNFLQYTVNHLTAVINSKLHREIAYLSLGKLFHACAPLRTSNLVGAIFRVVREGFGEPFCTAALHCLAMILSNSVSSRKLVTSEVIEEVFRGGLTSDLTDTLKVVIKHVPIVRANIQRQLREHITQVLQRYAVVVDDAAEQSAGKGADGGPSSASSSKRIASRFTRALASAGGVHQGLIVGNTSTPSKAAHRPTSSWSSTLHLFGGTTAEVVPTRTELNPDVQLMLAFQVLSSPEFFPKQIRERSDRLVASADTTHDDQMATLVVVLRNSVVRYLDDVKVEIRLAACKTCLGVMDAVALTVETGSSEHQMILRILDKMLVLAVGDESTEIRSGIFSAMTPSLDHIVAQCGNVLCVVEGLNDESIEVRAAAMAVLSRLAHFDPLHIMPVLRIMLTRLIKQLEHSRRQNERLESVRLLQALGRGASSLMLPHVSQVLVPLMALLDDPSPAIVGSVLSSISEVAVTSPESVREYLEKVFPRVIDALNDESSVATQEVAVVAMGKLVSSLALLTEEPYAKFPGLFSGLVRAIQKEEVSSQELRLQAIRTAGLLGAVDPASHQAHLRRFGNLVDNFAAGQDGLLLEDDGNPAVAAAAAAGAVVTLPTGRPSVTALQDVEKHMTKMERYYLSVVLRELTAIIMDPGLSHHHSQALSISIKVVRHVGPKAFLFTTDLIKGIVTRIYQSESSSNLREVLLDHLASIIYVIGRQMRKYHNMIVKIISDFFEAQMSPCLDIIETIYSIFSIPDFTCVLREVFPAILRVVQDEPYAETQSTKGMDSEINVLRAPSFNVGRPSPRQEYITLPKTMRILQCFSNMRDHLGEHKRQLIAVALDVLNKPNCAAETRRFALCVAMHLADDVDLPETANRIVQPLMRILSDSAVVDSSSSGTVHFSPLVGPALIALSCLLCRLGIGFLPFVVPVRRAIHNVPLFHGAKVPQLEEYESLVSKLLKQRPLPIEPMDASEISIKNTIQVRGGKTDMDGGPHSIGMQALETAWALANRDSASDLIDWMSRLSIELIRQSPSPIIRMCAPLTKVHRSMADKLFNASFSCIWDELYAGESPEVVDDIPLINGIEMALNSRHIPSDILNVLLNLAEFMDMYDKRLPIDVQLLANQAAEANMFAKCLRYREIEFNSPNVAPSTECIEDLISVNNELGLKERAAGVLHLVSIRYPHIEIKPRWLENLNHWDEARKAYLEQNSKFRASNPNGRALAPSNRAWMESEVGILRCLYALGEFEELTTSAISLKSQTQLRDQELDQTAQGWLSEVQTLGANAAWMLGKWDLMTDFIKSDAYVDKHDIELHKNTDFCRAVLAIHNHEYEEALSLVTQTRNQLSGAISALLSENYSRAYRAMVSMQILSEMEEVVEYKQAVARAAIDLDSFASTPQDQGHTSSRPQSTDLSGIRMSGSSSNLIDLGSASGMELTALRQALIRKWRGRLKWAPKEVDTYRQILAVHTLVVEPTEDLDSWLELVTLCRKEGMFSLCGNLLRRLGASNLSINTGGDEDECGLPVPPQQSITLGSFHTPPPPFTGLHGTPRAEKSNPHFRVLFASHKYLWACGERQRALGELTSFLDVVPRMERIDDGADAGSGFRTTVGMAERTYSTFGSTTMSSTELRSFRVACLLQRAEWMRALAEAPFEQVLATVHEAQTLAPDHYSVWHAWAVTNYDQLQKVEAEVAEGVTLNSGSQSPSLSSLLMLQLRDSPVASHPRDPGHETSASAPTVFESSNRKTTLTGMITPQRGASTGNAFSRQGSRSNSLSDGEEDITIKFIVQAVKGFVRSIVLGQGQPIANILQDTLRLLTLWFTYGSRAGVYGALLEELDQVSPENWLSVVPQLIARMHVNSPEIAGLLRTLLIKLAATHPQALVCPISVAFNTNNSQQKKMARDVLLEMRKIQSQLVSEATMVSRELMRVAMTPHEVWHDGLEAAAQQYLELKDVNAMLETLMGLHESMNDATTTSTQSGNVDTDFEGFSESVGKVSHTTLRDISFRQSYGRQLGEAQLWLYAFKQSRDLAHLHQAWEVYQQVFKRIKAQIKTFDAVELHHVSPALTSAVNLRLAVPGTYRPFAQTVSIQAFSASIEVIASKQRPRRMSVIGSDGATYQFLLKGHEDLRQDERVMQLFGLINVCLDNDRGTSNRGLSIVRYSVLPLSSNSGVIGWVENCDTLNQLVRQYREMRNVKLNLETRLLQNFCPHFNKLPLLNKVEVFNQVLEETSGQDLAKMLWLKSKTADAWVERRANFTKSMAVMSMVGYILGLGDRHPSNLMLDRVSGRVVHIDFGDCFEVTMKRAKFPEIVPFRLTRMLMLGMEKTGIEGTYRATAERVMRVLRSNRDSVMAMLEAFVYDPLISWRLLGDDEGQLTKDSAKGGPAAAAVAAAAQSSTSPSNTTSPRLTIPRDRDAPSDSDDDDSVDQNSGARASGLHVDVETSALTVGDAGDEAGTGTGAPPPISASMLDVARRSTSMDPPESDGDGGLNTRALEVITRIQAKLTGRDFAKSDGDSDLTVEQQVDRLIREATSAENLCQLYIGWCPMW